LGDWVSLVAGPLGALASLCIFLWGFKVGWWSTSLEVKAWTARATRAETQVDMVLPQVEKVLALVTTVAEEQKELARFTAVLMSFMEEQKREQVAARPAPRRGS
jgi:hypothetical protein